MSRAMSLYWGEIVAFDKRLKDATLADAPPATRRGEGRRTDLPACRLAVMPAAKGAGGRGRFRMAVIASNCGRRRDPSRRFNLGGDPNPRSPPAARGVANGPRSPYSGSQKDRCRIRLIASFAAIAASSRQDVACYVSTNARTACPELLAAFRMTSCKPRRQPSAFRLWLIAEC